MSHTRRFLALGTSLVTVALAVALRSTLPGASAGAPPSAAFGPETGTAVEYAISPPASQLPAPAVGSADTFRLPRINPLANEPDGGQRGTWNRPSVPADPLIGPPADPGLRTPALTLSFEGTGNPAACAGCSPPDTNGDVGPNHYIQMVNATKVAIFDKNGNSLAAPFNLGTLWPGGSICANNAGDPVVLYDPLADRWLLSQFGPSNQTHLCFAISQTPDPTGSYHLFTFNVGSFPDYFKVGVWPDAYYVGANESTYTAYAFNRAKMLAGDMTANFVKFTGQNNFLLPADLDGPTAPPAGSPGLFYTFKDDAFHGGGADRIEVFALAADFTTPANSTFTMPASLPIASFTYTVCGFFNLNCARQLGTATRLDVVSEWPMHRFPYRNFGTHQALVGNFTVGGGTGNVGAAIRWFELRNTGGGWTLFQQGTFDPGDGNDRFMGSIAMDASGDIALGYSVSSNTINPAIRYTTRAPGDPAGTMQVEAVLINGAGSQTGSNRWGDYSAMSVDPADDCTFWYTNEYYPVSAASTWKTRVGNFKYPGCGAVTPPPPATLVSPTGTIGTTMPTYTWNAVAQADSYYLWVNDSTGPAKVTQWIGPGTAGCGAGTGTCAFTPGTALAAGAATWWIQTWSTTGGYGPWSAPLYFTIAPPAATLVSPSGSISTNQPAYTWNAVAQADSYQLWVNDSAMSGKINQWLGPGTAGCGAGTGMCAFTSGTAVAPGAAIWWIRTWSTTLGYGPWSGPLTFMTAPPGATLVSPSGAIGTKMPTYTWNAVPLADSYYLWVNDSAGPAKVTQWIGPGTAGCGAGTGMCSFTPPTNLATGAATWWIQTWSVTLGYGPWSAPLTFTVP